MAKNATRASRIAGCVYGVLSGASFGLIPLFILPLQKAGMSTAAIVSWRFGLGALLLLPLARLAGTSLKASAGDLIRLAFISACFMLSMSFLFYSFQHLPSSVAVPLQYLYPVMVMCIMTFFGEKFDLRLVLAVGLVIAGVALLSQGSGGDSPDSGAASSSASALIGVSLALASALATAVLNVSLKVSRVSRMDGIALSFYMLLFALGYSFIQDAALQPLVWRPADAGQLALLFLLGLVTADLANIFLIWSIERIGPTLASILGVVQPLTSVFCGILVFGEPVNLRLILGICVVTLAVFLAILKPRPE